MNHMQHICIGCGYKEFNTNATSPSTCEKCGEQMLHSWDEPYEHETMCEVDED